jgi:hypothetical protein
MPGISHKVPGLKPPVSAKPGRPAISYAPPTGEGDSPAPNTTLPDWWGISRATWVSAGSKGPLQVQGSATGILPVVYGSARLDGVALYWHVEEPAQATGIIALCEGEISSVEHFYINGTELFAGDHRDGSGQGYVLTVFLGAAGDTVPFTHPPYDITGWTAGPKPAYVKLEAYGLQAGYVNPWWRGIWPWMTQGPTTLVFTAEVHGKKIYDPRGGGSTAYTASPPLIFRDLYVTYKRMLSGQMNDTVIGASADACASLGLSCNIVFNQLGSLDAAVNEVLLTCNGIKAVVNGGTCLFIDQAQPGAASVTLLEEDGGIADLSYKWLSSATRPTRITVQFLNSAAGFVPDSFVVEDSRLAGGTVPLRESTFAVRGCTTQAQAQILADYLFNSSAVTMRALGRIAFRGAVLSQGMKVHLTTLAGVDADFLIEQIDHDQSGMYPVVLRPYDAAVYESTPITQGPPVVVPPPIAGWDPTSSRVRLGSLTISKNANNLVTGYVNWTPPLELASALYGASHWSATGYATWDPSKINDGSDTSGIAVTTNADGVTALDVVLDLGTGQTSRFVSLRVAGYSGGVAGDPGSRTGRVQIDAVGYSDNGSSWTMLTVVGTTVIRSSLDAVNDQRAYYEWADAGAHRYWKIHLNATGGNGECGFTEAQFYSWDGTTYAWLDRVEVWNYIADPANPTFAFSVPASAGGYADVTALLALQSSGAPGEGTVYTGFMGLRAVSLSGVGNDEPIILRGSAWWMPSEIAMPFVALRFAATEAAQTGSAVLSGSLVAGELAGPLVRIPEATLPSVSAAGQSKVAMDSSDHKLKASVNGGAFAKVGTGDGTVTSVALAMPSDDFDVSGSPVTGSGTLTAAKKTKSANYVLAGPTSGGAAAPTFRALVAADIPGGVGGAPTKLTSVGGSPTITGTIDGTNTSFTTSSSAGSVFLVLVDGMPDVDATWTTTSLTTGIAPRVNVIIYSWS